MVCYQNNNTDSVYSLSASYILESQLALTTKVNKGFAEPAKLCLIYNYAINTFIRCKAYIYIAVAELTIPEVCTANLN